MECSFCGSKNAKKYVHARVKEEICICNVCILSALEYILKENVISKDEIIEQVCCCD